MWEMRYSEILRARARVAESAGALARLGFAGADLFVRLARKIVIMWSSGLTARLVSVAIIAHS